jgi:hypothetical protein
VQRTEWNVRDTGGLKTAWDQPLTLQGSEYAHAVQELNKAIDRAEKLIQD